MMAAFAELERYMIRERTMASLTAARAQGRTRGRPTLMEADTVALARAGRANGKSLTQITKALGVSRGSIYRHLPTSDTSNT
jgi:DNA invertase Pin-like site-specific DNA recombinase